MADDQNRPKWYHTAPGYLTATAALVGSITAAVTGLSQLGVFHSKSAAPAPAVAPLSVPTRTTPERGNGGSTHRVAPEMRAPSRSTGTGGGTAPSGPPATSHPAPPPAPTPAPVAAPVPPPTAPVARTGSIGPGTTLELASGSRVCSTNSNAGDKFTATTVTPVSGSNGVTLPVGTQVILSVVPKKAPVFIGASGVSLDVGGKSVKVSGNADAQTEFTAGPNQTGLGIGACIPQGGRISLRLTDGVTITQP
jgi:hypothetical protein